MGPGEMETGWVRVRCPGHGAEDLIWKIFLAEQKMVNISCKVAELRAPRINLVKNYDSLQTDLSN